MLAEVGLLATFFAFVAGLYAAGASFYGVRRRNDAWVISARNAALLTLPLLLVATGALLVALLTEQYQMSYVWSVTDPETPTFYRITALWGAQEGSLLFWSLLMSAFSAAALALNWRSNRMMMPYVIIFTMATLIFFVGMVLFLENPFQRYWLVGTNAVESLLIPANAVAPSPARLAETAQGLKPLLRHFGMIIHPPMLYLGFVGFVIPFAYAMAALAAGDLTTNWIRATRRWALVAWIFLSLGLILGGRWAYDVLGWGGYWGWDPVENAAFLPWLIGTAFLHSVMIQEKRGMLKVWNLFLVIGTFSAVIFGTFATRSGLIDSVHSFARSPIGVPMFLFWSGMTIVGTGLIMWRRNRGELVDEHRFVSPFSREALFVLNNVVFVVLFVAIFWGSFGAPIVSELFLNTNITLGKDYFMQVTPPLFAALYILMGIAPLSAWGITSFRQLGRGLLVPVLLSLGVVVVLAVMGMSTPAGLLGYGIVSLGGMVALYEIYRGVRARAKRKNDGANPALHYLQALIELVSRNRRRYGGYIIHFGVTVIGIGIIGSTLYQQETQQTLAQGQSLNIGGYVMTFDRFDGGLIAEDGRIMDVANVTVSRDGQALATLRPRRDFYPGVDSMNSSTIAAAYSTLENDFYVLLVDWETINAASATFKVYVNPLINLVWWGSFILIFGTMIAAWWHEPAIVTQTSAVSEEKKKNMKVRLA